MIARATAMYGTIHPCSGKSFQECFTFQENRLIFWFNDGNGNTHAIIREAMAIPA